MTLMLLLLAAALAPPSPSLKIKFKVTQTADVLKFDKRSSSYRLIKTSPSSPHRQSHWSTTSPLTLDERKI